MIAFLRGNVDTVSPQSVILDVNGVGYEVYITAASSEKLPSPGHQVTLHIVESVSPYGGSTSLYGFLSADDKDMFVLLKENVPGAGAKKALEYLDKVSRSLFGFQTAVVHKDVASLTGEFGFTKKTADKIIAALKDKLIALPDSVISGTKRTAVPSTPASDAIAGLLVLGYKEQHARAAIERVLSEQPDIRAVEAIIKQALRFL